MPVISRFFGIAIRMYYQDHAPPHFHARYGEHEATFAVANSDLLEGRLPRRARRRVQEWSAIHREALFLDWNLARAGQPLQPIPPLE